MITVIGGLLLVAFTCALMIAVGLLTAKLGRSAWRRFTAWRWQRFERSQYLSPTWEWSAKDGENGRSW